VPLMRRTASRPPTGTALPRERVSDLEADELLYTDDQRLTGKLAGGR
jgi:hypothetical protein